MSKEKLAGIIGGCVAGIIAIVAMVTLPPTSGEAHENTAFHINVIPETPELINGEYNFKYSIPGQHFVFLVTITDEEQGGQLPVRISAKAPGAQVVIYQQDIVEGQVAEVVIIPTQKSVGKTIKVTITGSQGSLTDKKVVSFKVAEGEDDRQNMQQSCWISLFPGWQRIILNWESQRIQHGMAYNGAPVRLGKDRPPSSVR